VVKLSYRKFTVVLIRVRELKEVYKAIAPAVQQQLSQEYPAEKTYVSPQEIAEKLQTKNQQKPDKT
jgi:hypothetical protein